MNDKMPLIPKSDAPSDKYRYGYNQARIDQNSADQKVYDDAMEKYRAFADKEWEKARENGFWNGVSSEKRRLESITKKIQSAIEVLNK